MAFETQFSMPKVHLCPSLPFTQRAPDDVLLLVGLLLYESYHMDRDEALHAASYDLNDKRKNTPDENELVLRHEISTFTKLRARGKPSTKVSAGRTRRESQND